jgi:RNA polymerase-binding transcription factor DksA
MTDCRICGDEIDPPERARLKPYCLMCGEDMARAERRSWTVVQEYGKGGYMFVTQQSAHVTLKQTNQKNLRCDI